MDSEDTTNRACGICNAQDAVTECDGCLIPLCKKCRSIEIWRTPTEEVVIRYFCPQCRENAKTHPRGKSKRVFGLGQVTDMVNQGLGKVSRFKIKLKV
ncbi:MAG TPA: hypothetical protein PLT09_02090 [Deltaproteobacteria bacterium]|nr:hypothetical protein [Deltaproteobacteria bacterium]HPR56219.1 hypothetical protein [Deltaproteobacteria bacterium]HXK46204.1 hypothetical protein [Deltaproteobacteria bacterium]